MVGVSYFNAGLSTAKWVACSNNACFNLDTLYFMHYVLKF